MMIHWGGVGIGILLCYIKVPGVQCTVCSEAAALDNIEVIRMCQSGSTITQRVVIDTYDTGDPDVYSCTCTARPYKTSSGLVSFGMSYKLDQEANCGSTLSVQSSQTDSVSFDCERSDLVYRKQWKSFEFILSRTTRSKPWQYGYCILLDTDAVRWNISCLQPISMTLQPTTSTTTSTSSKTRPTSTRRPTTTTSTISSVSVTQTSSSNRPGSSTERNCSPQTVEVFSTATVVVPIVIVVLIAVVTTIANVILYRRRLALDKEPKNTHHVLQSSVSVVYDSIDVDRLEPPHTYADTNAGRMYANTAASTNAGGMYENTAASTSVSKP